MEDRGGHRERARDEQSPWKDGRPSSGWTPPRATCGTDEDGKRTQQSSPSAIRQAGPRSAMAPSAPEKAKRGYGRATGSGACRPLRRPRTPGSRAASRSAWAGGSLLWPSPRHCPAPGKAHLTPKSVQNLLEVTACGRETLGKTCPGPFFTPLFGPEACPGPPALDVPGTQHTAPLQLLVCPQDDLCDCTFWAFLLPLPGSKLSWSAAAPGHPIWKNQCVLFREQAPRGPLSPPASARGRAGQGVTLFASFSASP